MPSDDVFHESRSSGCPSARDLELFAFTPGGEYGGSRVPQHVRACATCGDLVAALQVQRTAFLAARPPDLFMRALAERSQTESARPAARGRSRRLVYAAVAAAAVAMLAVIPFDATWTSQGSRGEVRLRGQVTSVLKVFVSRDGATALPLGPDETLLAGDVLRFGVQTDRSGYATVFNVDDRGRVSRYLPQGPGEALRVEANGGTTVLAGSIRLDDFVGKELLVLAITETPPAEAQLAAALGRAYVRSGGQLAQLDLTDLDAELSVQLIHKRAP